MKFTQKCAHIDMTWLTLNFKCDSDTWWRDTGVETTLDLMFLTNVQGYILILDCTEELKHPTQMFAYIMGKVIFKDKCNLHTWGRIVGAGCNTLAWCV